MNVIRSTIMQDSSFARSFQANRWLYFMLLPGILYFLIFKYAPMWGLLISFQNYQPFLGIFRSPWVGFKHFERFLLSPTFFQLFRNTILLAVYNLFFFFPLPIVLALMINEIRSFAFKRIVQTLTYIPHFFSWVVIAGITYLLFTTEGGLVNELIVKAGGTKIPFLTSPDWFRPIITLQNIWRDVGWGTIVFMATLAGIDPQLYEAATIDGASRWHQLLHITLPSLRSTVVILLVLRLGRFLDTGFEQIFLMLNAMNREVGDVFDTYVYDIGIIQGQYSYSTAIGMFKSIVCLILVIVSNKIAKKYGEEGVY